MPFADIAYLGLVLATFGVIALVLLAQSVADARSRRRDGQREQRRLS